MGSELYRELERTCKRTEKELHDLNDRLEQNKNMMSPADLDVLVKITDIIKDVKSTLILSFSCSSGTMACRYQPRAANTECQHPAPMVVKSRNFQ